MIQLLEKRRAGRTWQDVAAEIGISASVLSRIRKGYAQPGNRLLAYLGLREETVYVKVEQAQ